MFFDGSMRSLRNISLRSPTSVVELGAARCGRRREPASVGERVGVGAERRRERRRDVGSRPSISRADAVVRARPARGVEARTAPRPSTRRCASAMSVGSTRIEFGPQNGVWVKCATRRSGRALAHHAGDERELVVLHEHDVAVGRVARRPRRRTRGSPRRRRPTRRGSGGRSVGRRGEVEEPVVQEPEHRVRDDVVVQPVQRGSRSSSVEVEPGRGRRAGRDRGAVVVVERGRDPRRASSPVPSTSASGRSALDEAAGAAAGVEAAVVVAPRTGTALGARRRRHGASAQLGEEAQPVLELAGREEVLAHVLAALRAQRVGADRVGEQVDGALRALLDRVDEVAVVAVADLQLDAAGAPADRPAGPSRAPRSR